MPRIYHSGGDVMLEGYGRLDSDAQAHLADVTTAEALAAFIARDANAFEAAKATGKQLLRARQEARSWMRAGQGVA